MHGLQIRSTGITTFSELVVSGGNKEITCGSVIHPECMNILDKWRLDTEDVMRR